MLKWCIQMRMSERVRCRKQMEAASKEYGPEVYTKKGSEAIGAVEHSTPKQVNPGHCHS